MYCFILRKLFPLGLLLFCASPVFAQEPEPAGYRQRCAEVISAFTVPGDTKDLFSVMAKYATGKADSSTAAYLDSLLEKPQWDMFWMYQIAGIYFYGSKGLSPAQKEKILRSFSEYNGSRGITENHTLMYYSSLFLISGEDPDNHLHWSNKKSSTDNHKEAGDILKTWMNRAFQTGFSEFNSPNYGGFYFSPLLTLYDFSKDPEIKSHAKIILWRMLADLLIHYHHSVIAGAESRVVDEDVFDKKDSAMARLMRFFLGGPLEGIKYHGLFFALSKFTYPEILNQIWRESQKRDFVEIDLERSMDKIRFSKDKYKKLNTYLYSGNGFALGSLVEGHDDEFQNRTWSLDWTGSGKNTMLFGLNPFMSKYALASYFPGDVDQVYAGVLSQRHYYNDLDKWLGASPYENLFQHENVLLGIYDIPRRVNNNAVSFFISKDINSTVLQGHTLLARTESIYFALRFSKVPQITEVKQGWRYRIHGKKPSFVLEVYPSSQFASLSEFSQAISKETVSFGHRQVKFNGMNGKEMRLSVQGKKTLNDIEFKYPTESVYSSPFMNVENGVMTIKSASKMVKLDWAKHD